MVERFSTGFDPFVIPFLAGMAFVLAVCLLKAVRAVCELGREDRKKFLLSLLNPNLVIKDIADIILDCLIHVRLWKRNRVLGFMHSSIAFGWFMIILLGHVEVLVYYPHRLATFYYPIFFDYFVSGAEGTLVSRMMDGFLLLIIAGILLAVVKRFRSRLFGMRRTARPSLINLVGLYSLWAIFPLRLFAEHCARAGELSTTPWWAYSTALCVFMVVLPFSRYLHIPAEMLLIMMRNAGVAVDRPHKGLARVQADSCPNCGLCIDACPMNADRSNLKDSTVYFTRQLRRGNRSRVEQISDKCMLCGKCSSVCQVGVDGPKLRILARAARKYRISPDFSGVVPQAPVRAEGKLLYFSGCMSQLTPAIGKSVESVLKKAGVGYGWMDRDGGLCCGRPLHTAGRLKESAELIRRNEELILGSGASTLLVSCPICYREFRERYNIPGVRVVHYADYFCELMDSGAIRLEKGDTCYVYHDPCELGRGCGIYESPRRLISRAAAIAEAELNRSESVCCGGSLGSLSLDFAHREKITRASLENLYGSKADAIATACPLCLSTFSRYSDRPVKDIAQIIDEQSNN